MENQQEVFEHWAILEVFGHERYAGQIKEATIAGKGVVQLSVPAIEGEHPLPAFTKFFNPDSIFSTTIVGEEYAMEMARRLKKHPITAYEHQELIRNIAEKAVSEMKWAEVQKLMQKVPE